MTEPFHTTRRVEFADTDMAGIVHFANFFHSPLCRKPFENELMVHPKVADVAVFGIPDDEWGEQIKAVVEPVPGADPGPELAAELLRSLEGRLAKMKWPRSANPPRPCLWAR